MKRSSAALIFLSTAAFAGLNLATAALRLDQAKPQQVDLGTNGVLAHVCDGGFGGAVQVDVKRVSDEEKIRLEIDPRVKTPGSLVLHQLPPGRYVATKLLLADRDPVPFATDTFEIQSGRVTSFGKVKVAPETNMLGQMKRLIIKTDSLNIGARLKLFTGFGIDTLPVAPQSIDWSIEPEKTQVDKGLST